MGLWYSLFRFKYCESNGIKVLTPVKSYSKERKAEFQRRDWMDLNSMEDLQ